MLKTDDLKIRVIEVVDGNYMDSASWKLLIDGFKEISRLSNVVGIHLMRDIDDIEVGIEAEHSPFEHSTVLVLGTKIRYECDGFHSV